MTHTPEALVDALDVTWTGTSDVLHRIDSHQWDASTGCPGWTVKDQLSHLVWAARLWAGKHPEPLDLPDLPHLDGPFADYVEVDVHRRRTVPGPEVLAEFDRERATAMASLRTLLQQGRLDEPFDGPMGMTMTRAQFLPTSVFDEWVHGNDIREAVDCDLELTSVAADVSFETIASMLSTRTERSVHLQLTGDRREAHDLGPGPTVATVRIDAAELARRAAGRSTATGVVDVTGDPAAGAALLELLPVTP